MSARGFTLVEMLVSLLVFALLCAAGVAVMAHAVDSRGLVAGRVERLGELQRARALLQQDLAQAAPRRVRDGRGEPVRGAFHAAPDGVGDPLLSFVRRGIENPEALPRGSLEHVTYRLVEDRLERSRRSALDGAAPRPPQVVLRGVRSLRMAYRHDGQWSPAWPGGRASLPEAIELRVELDGVGELRQVFLMPGWPP